MKVAVDSERCIGCGVCAAIAPKYFKINEEGKSVAIKDTVDEEDTEKVKSAAESCPVNAITVE